MDDSGGESHKYVSVPVCFSVRWKRAEDTAMLKAEIVSHRTSDRYMAPPPAFSESAIDAADLVDFQRSAPHIFKMWAALEKKLDYLIRLTSRQAADDQSFSAGMCLSLSEGGAVIKLAEPIAKDDLLRLRLNPPAYPMVMVETLAKVVAVTPDPEKQEEILLEVEFDAINHMDREEIVQFLFRRQREILQKKRE
ncbi:MAG: PilZ domain-containing protein [Nitrospinae bacterium]|nr:PilZ domain-containing protein [Nitrospinota bacterium]